MRHARHTAAAASLKAQGVSLYALVNNAGVGLQTATGDADALLNTNFYGPKRVSEAMIDLIDPAAIFPRAHILAHRSTCLIRICFAG